MIVLPPARLDGSISIERTLATRRSIRAWAAAPLSLSEVAQLLWAAQGITDDDGGRTAPSAGATYPLEIVLIAGSVGGLDPGVYRYRPEEHALVPTAPGDRRSDLAAAYGEAWIRECAAAIVIGARFERTARRYGRRAERYVPFEAGHAAENVHLQAVALGIGTVIVGAFSDAETKRVACFGPGVEPLIVLPLGRRA